MNTTHISTVPTPAASTAAVTPADFLQAFLAIHAAMRRDAARLAPAVRRAATNGEVPALVTWFRRVVDAIELHHIREDDTVWPELEARDQTFAGDRSVLEHDHHELDEAMAATSEALEALVRDGQRSDAASVEHAADTAANFATLLVAHLDREEAVVVGRMSREFSAAEYEAIEQTIIRRTPMRHFAFELPWIIDGMPAAQVAELRGVLPFPLRIAERAIFTPRYRRRTAALFS